ncbi:MAG: acyl-CoA thioesterase [Anaerolineae bacterium]|nr:MAG: acyl-CoA thioesterase [Anaerolineae bacterium]
MAEPKRYSRIFRVRQYECDMYGHVNNANYLRYMQEAAIEASAAVGYDVARYNQMGKLWLPRLTEIEYNQALKYGDEFEIVTWVEDIRRVRSLRVYEFRRAGEVAARASTDWVFMDAATRKPESVPPDLMAAYFDDGLPEPAERRAPFPTPPPPAPRLVIWPHTVNWRDVDMAGHVNNAQYLSLMEDATLEVGRAFGWSLERSLSQNLAWVVRRATLEYRTQAHYADALEITTYLANVRRSSASRFFFVKQQGSGELVVQAQLQYVLIDLGSGRPVAIPEELRRDYADNVSPEATK